jgi:hypothetical protein
MKRKVLTSFFVIILILTLTGCGRIPEGLPEEWMGVEEMVYQYWQAIINRQYGLAECYCIYDGIWHNKIDEWEEYINTNSEDETSLMIYGPSFYKQTEVIGDNAIAYIWIFVHKITFPDIYSADVDTFEYEVELIKETSPPGRWILK